MFCCLVFLISFGGGSGLLTQRLLGTEVVTDREAQ